MLKSNVNKIFCLINTKNSLFILPLTFLNLACTPKASAPNAVVSEFLNSQSRDSYSPNSKYNNSSTYLSLNDIQPPSGSSKGGDQITLKGQGFKSGASVTVNGNPCNQVTLVNDTEIQCTTGPHTFTELNTNYQYVKVRVTNSDGKLSENSYSFRYKAPTPTVNSVSPVRGPNAGGTQIQIIGTDFLPQSSVRIDYADCLNVHYNSPTSITCTTPASTYGSAHSVLVQVLNNNSYSAQGQLVQGFAYEARIGIDATTRARQDARGHAYDVNNFQQGTLPIVTVESRRAQARVKLNVIPAAHLPSSEINLERWKADVQTRNQARLSHINNPRGWTAEAGGQHETIMTGQTTKWYLESISRLEERYPAAFANAETSIRELYLYVENLNVSHLGQQKQLKKAAAMRYLERVLTDFEDDRNFPSYHFSAPIDDPYSSGLKQKQVISLAWAAVNDRQIFHAERDREARKWGYLESLALIQRAHNETEQTITTEGGNSRRVTVVNFNDHIPPAPNTNDLPIEADFPSCGPGTFKRLLEHLDGFHTDVRMSSEVVSAHDAAAAVQAGQPAPSAAPAPVAHIGAGDAFREIQAQHTILFRTESSEAQEQIITGVPHGTAYLNYVDRLRAAIHTSSPLIPVHMIEDNTNADMMEALLGG